MSINQVEEQHSEYSRDEDGNVIFPNININNSEINRWQATYIFHEWDDSCGYYIEIANLFCDADFIEQKATLAQNNIIVYQLFELNEILEKDRFYYRDACKNLLHHFFKEVFKFPDSVNYISNTFDKARIIIRKNVFDDIQQLINAYNLSEIRDLIFFIIAKIGDVYVKEIEFFTRPEMVKQINNASKDSEKLITVIERVRPEFYERLNNKPLPQLSNITFNFPDIKPIKIEDPWLNSSLIDAIKKDFEDRPLKNWRKEVKKFAELYNEDIEKQKYRFHVAIALHNFFTYTKHFPVKVGNATADAEMLCIAKILEFGLIKIGSEGISDAQKIKNIRNYIKPERNQLFTFPSHIEAKPNLKILEKYFEKTFLELVPMQKEIGILKTAIYISERFDIQHLRDELLHLIDCIKYRKFQLSMQFSLQGASSENHPIIGSLFRLISPFRIEKNKIQLSELSFKVKNNPNTYTIKEDLPLMLIEKALTEYYNNHQEEFDIDILASNFKMNTQSSSLNIEERGGFKKQSDRFLPTLCASLYKFLLNEAPPERNVASATDKYSEIIAIILQHAFVFNHLRDDELLIQEKVKQWLKDTKSN